jgi:uncharacterized membrane protein
MQNQKSALGMDGNVTALIGYIVGILALVLIFIEKDNKFVRFHALQSLLWWIGYWVILFVVCIALAIVGTVLSMISSSLGGLVWGLIGLLAMIAWLPLLGGVIYAAYKAYSGEMTKLPIVGNLAEKWA